MTREYDGTKHIPQPGEQLAIKPIKRTKGANQPNELHDVFRFINMHDGNKDVCWEWLGAHSTDPKGHKRPRWKINNKQIYASRAVFEAYYGIKVEGDKRVLHSCDNPSCCNPYHLRIGTQSDNNRDMMERERVHLKRVIVKKIMSYLELGFNSQIIADQIRNDFGQTVSGRQIRHIRARARYAHIEWPWGDEQLRLRRERLALSGASGSIDTVDADADDNHNEGADND